MVEKERPSDPYPGLDYLWDRLSQIDDFDQLVLNTHLEIEAEMDVVLDLALFHPEHIKGLRRSFVNKVFLIRALYPKDDHAKLWETVLAFNQIRNDIAHGKNYEKRTEKVEKVRKQLVETWSDNVTHRKFIEQADEEDMVLYVAAFCTNELFAMRWKMMGPEGLRLAEENRESAKLQEEGWEFEPREAEEDEQRERDRTEPGKEESEDEGDAPP
jgi:hypothetical protein